MQIKLEELADGAFEENVQKAIEKVVANLLDPNTPWKNKRSVTAKISFTQNEDRDDSTCDISVETKLAPVKPVGTRFAIGKDLKTGEVFAEEYGKQIRGQMTINDVQEPKTVVVDGKEVETETGEIKNDTVVDFKAKQA
jgi:hypothetical protein